MQTASLTEWLNSQETKALITYLKFRQAAVVTDFLRGQGVNQTIQGKAAGFNEVERLLREPPEKIIAALENAVKELNEQHRRA
jgi:hypothetical protein